MPQVPVRPKGAGLKPTADDVDIDEVDEVNITSEDKSSELEAVPQPQTPLPVRT